LRGYPTAFAAPTYKMMAENWRAINQIIALLWPGVMPRSTGLSY